MTQLTANERACLYDTLAAGESASATWNGLNCQMTAGYAV